MITIRGQSNLPTVFILVSCEEKGYYRAVAVGQLSFDCRLTAALLPLALRAQPPYARFTH